MIRGSIGAFLTTALLATTLVAGCGTAKTEAGGDAGGRVEASQTEGEGPADGAPADTEDAEAADAAEAEIVHEAVPVDAVPAEISARTGGKGVEGAVVVTDAASLAEQELPLYYRTPVDVRPIRLYFADEGHEIPYLDTDTAAGLLEDIYHDVNRDEGFSLSSRTEGHTVTLTRENSYTMEIDCDADEIRFMDFDAFFMPSHSPTVIDVLEHYGLIDCLERVPETSYSRYGSRVTIELAPYGIDLIERDGTCYLPMQTFVDLCTSLTSYMVFLYNGQSVCVDEFGSEYEQALISKYYEARPTGARRSQALANFTYQELCMTLDYCYGLKQQHNIGSFDAFFGETGLKRRMLDSDPMVSTMAVSDLVNLYFSDGHSQLIGNSYRIGQRADTETRLGKSTADLDGFKRDFEAARARYYPDGVPGYEEVGDTAYITFDSFSGLPSDVDYYLDAPTAGAVDTTGICLYAFSQITREGSPVRNVVLDLSVNDGGDTTVACFVLSMFLGQASVVVEDTLTGAYTNAAFRCDANLDGTFDEHDSLAGYRLFCLTSPSSFSCGNLVPSIMQNSGKVKTLGMTSGGGACIVMPMATADGTVLTISGYRRMGYMKNGSIYDIDRGVDVDYPITSAERLYDREALTAYINSLY